MQILMILNFDLHAKLDSAKFIHRNADMAQLVEHNLAKVGVAGSSPVVRSMLILGIKMPCR